MEKFELNHKELLYNKSCVDRAFEDVQLQLSRNTQNTNQDMRYLMDLIQQLATNTDLAIKKSQEGRYETVRILGEEFSKQREYILKLERDIEEVRNLSSMLRARVEQPECQKANLIKEELDMWKEENERRLNTTTNHMEAHFETNISAAIERNANRIREELEKTWTKKIGPLVVKEIKTLKGSKILEAGVTKEDIDMTIEQKMEAALASIKEEMDYLRAQEERDNSS